MNGVKEVYPEVFDTYGTELIHSASKKERIIMDEIGFLEEKAEQFQKAVLSALDENIPVIAAIKAKSITTPFRESVRSHENVQLIELNETNRDQIYEQLRSAVHEQEEGPAMKNITIRDLILLAFFADIGFVSKRLIAPFANVITDFLRVPGGIGTAFS